jgi:hypothetical protein
MDGLHLLRAYIAVPWSDIVWAAGFALVFAVILDLLAIGSRLRAWIRNLKNKWSERSAAQLRKRINQLENQRDSVAAYLSSDKALYLTAFRIVIGMLLAIAFGAGISVLGDMLPVGPFGLFSIVFYVLAVAMGIEGLKTSSLDTRTKVSEMVAKLDSEVLDLQKKLETIAK